MKQEYKELIELWANIESHKSELKRLEDEYEHDMNISLPKIWEEFANGKKWENDENYHLGCPVCNSKAIACLIKARADD